MRAILITIRHPDRHAEGAQYRQTVPAVGVKLLMSMTCHNGTEQVFRGAVPGRARACTRAAELMVVFPV